MQCVIRAADGGRLVRRLRPNDHLQTLFDAAAAAALPAAATSRCSLATTFPTRVFNQAEHGPCTLQALGLAGPQLAFFLQPSA